MTPEVQACPPEEVPAAGAAEDSPSQAPPRSPPLANHPAVVAGAAVAARGAVAGNLADPDARLMVIELNEEIGEF